MVFFDSTKKIHISQNKKFQDNRRATFKKNTFFFLKHFFKKISFIISPVGDLLTKPVSKKNHNSCRPRIIPGTMTPQRPAQGRWPRGSSLAGRRTNQTGRHWMRCSEWSLSLPCTLWSSHLQNRHIAHTQPTHYINTVHAQVYIYMISHINTITGKITNKKYLVYS